MKPAGVIHETSGSKMTSVVFAVAASTSAAEADYDRSAVAKTLGRPAPSCPEMCTESGSEAA